MGRRWAAQASAARLKAADSPPIPITMEKAPMDKLSTEGACWAPESDMNSPHAALEPLLLHKPDCPSLVLVRDARGGLF